MNISRLTKGLPKQTKSICPECKAILDAYIYEDGGKVLIEKNCPEHGYFSDIYWSDADFYRKAEEWARDGAGLLNPRTSYVDPCPLNCGLCDEHLSHTALAVLDLTNRCNLRCPICFANAAATGYVYEPSYEQVVAMLKNLRENRPVPTPAVQFAGGEPTVYPRFFDVIRKAKELGFVQIQVATNGLKLVRPEYTQKMLDAGVHTVYFQFDGLREENYIQARGRPLLDKKLKVIENCRNTKPKPLSTVLVPTILNTINDDQTGEILKFAIENRDVIRGVVYQPVSFSGRIDKEEREMQRFTLPDLAERLEKQTDFLRKDDFYPVPSVTAVSQLASALSGEQKIAFTSHPHCGIATYLFIGNDGKPTPITRFADIDGILSRMAELSSSLSKKPIQWLMKLRKKSKNPVTQFDKYFGEYINYNKMPDDIDITQLFASIFSKRDKESLSDFSWRTLLISGMHFQDYYNFDTERVRRCCIHYPTPDGRIIPFCSYNTLYREEVERKYAKNNTA